MTSCRNTWLAVLVGAVAIPVAVASAAATHGYYIRGSDQVIVDATATHVTGINVVCKAVAGSRFYRGGGNITKDGSFKISSTGRFSLRATIRTLGSTPTGGTISLPVKASISGTFKNKIVRLSFSDRDTNGHKLCGDSTMTLNYRGVTISPGH